MAHKFEPRVRETSSTTLTADFVLAGAMRGSLAFGQVMATGDTCDYVASYDSSFEEGLGTMQADGKLARTSVYRARHANGDINTSKVSFAAGVKTVIMTFAASRAALLPALTTGAVRADQSQSFTTPQKAQARSNIDALLAFASGTKMLFQQTSAPTGWTKDTTHNDKALRVVSGTASSGGSSPFSTVFGKTATDAHTLTVSEIPAHSHVATDTGHTHTTDAFANISVTGPGTTINTTTGTKQTGLASANITVQNTGGGGSHTHPMDIRVNYVDVIIASKD